FNELRPAQTPRHSRWANYNTIIHHLICSILNECQTAVCLGALFLPDAVGLTASGFARWSHLRRDFDSPLQDRIAEAFEGLAPVRRRRAGLRDESARGVARRPERVPLYRAGHRLRDDRGNAAG